MGGFSTRRDPIRTAVANEQERGEGGRSGAGGENGARIAALARGMRETLARDLGHPLAATTTYKGAGPFALPPPHRAQAQTH